MRNIRHSNQSISPRSNRPTRQKQSDLLSNVQDFKKSSKMINHIPTRLNQIATMPKKTFNNVQKSVAYRKLIVNATNFIQNKSHQKQEKLNQLFDKILEFSNNLPEDQKKPSEQYLLLNELKKKLDSFNYSPGIFKKNVSAISSNKSASLTKQVAELKKQVAELKRLR